MARLIEPQSFLSQRELFKNIFDKDDADGTSSVIRPYLTENDISLSADKADGDEAATHEAAAKLLAKQSENHRQMRDLRFAPVFANMQKGFQFLKKLYGKNYLKVGEWGAPITVNGKINYPTDVAQQIALWGTYYAKHTSYPVGSSPLIPFLTENEIDIDADDTKAGKAAEANTKFKDEAKHAEDETQLRNNLWLPVVAHMTGIGQYLMKLYEKNTKNLGKWGFVVDDSKQKPKEVTSKVKLSQKITITSEVIGGTLTNLGPVDLHLYKGKSTAGTPIIIHPNEKFGIAKGWSTITVVNPSALQGGIVKVLRSR